MENHPTSPALDRRAGITLLTALGMTALMGAAGMALDLGAAYAQKTRLQAVADSAALAGALSYAKSSGSTTAMKATIDAVVKANGYAVATEANTTGFLKTSPKNAANSAVQVVLASPYRLTLTEAVTTLVSLTTTVTSVAEISATAGSGGSAAATPCVNVVNTLMVNSSLTASGCVVQAGGALTVNGGATVTGSGVTAVGTVQNNGTIAGSLTSNGSLTNNGGATVGGNVSLKGSLTNNGTINGSVTAASVSSNGGSKITGTTTISSTGGGATAPTDPYTGAAAAESSAFSSSHFSNCQNYNNQTTITTPGCYQNVNLNSGSSLSVQGSASGGSMFYFTSLNINSTFTASNATIVAQSLNINGGATFTGTNVTLITQNSFSPNGTMSITAPAYGSYNGIAIYPVGGMNFNGGSNITVNGALYMPASGTTMNLNTVFKGCTYLFVYNLTLNGGSSIPQSSCSSYSFTKPGVTTATVTTVALVQ